MVKTLTRQGINFCHHIQNIVPFDHSKILNEIMPMEKPVSDPQQ